MVHAVDAVVVFVSTPLTSLVHHPKKLNSLSVFSTNNALFVLLLDTNGVTVPSCFNDVCVALVSDTIILKRFFIKLNVFPYLRFVLCKNLRLLFSFDTFVPLVHLLPVLLL